MSSQSTPERLDSRGLDFKNLASITPEEAEAFRESYRSEDGNQQSGFDFLIDNNPGALKTYRYFATAIQPPFRDPRYQAPVFGAIGQYGLLDFDEGVRYCIVPTVRAGYTKEQVLEGMSLAFMVGGTRAMVCVGRALKGFEWPDAAEDIVEWLKQNGFLPGK